MKQTFRLKDFDGPLDLLLTLVNKAKIDIRDIFVSEITDQYLQIVREADDLDMNEASDFLVMAATLLEIKSRTLLPKPPEPEEGEEDPEAELIRRLEEYKRFKETAGTMREYEQAASESYGKMPEEYPLPPPEIELTGLTMESLQAALARVLARKPAAAYEEGENRYARREIVRDEHTVRECMLNLTKRVRKRKRLRFEDAFTEAATKEEVITYFLAMLELMRLGRIHLRQTDVYGEIVLIHGSAEEDEKESSEESIEGSTEKRPEEAKEKVTDSGGTPSGETPSGGFAATSPKEGGS